MPSNKRIRRPRSRTARELVAETAPANAADLKRQVHRLEVEIAATGRLALESRRNAPGIWIPPASGAKSAVSRQSLTFAQMRKRRARRLMQTGMFVTSTCLLGGAAAWLYRFWQVMQ